MVTTKTIGPLHLEDLEPHRFEDLIRQLLYDFKTWQRLEASGRSGADQGFDALGVELIPEAVVEPEADGEGDVVRQGRIWLVQCKREKAISPKKLKSYLEDLPKPEGLHGIIFAAACDFSMAARDAFRQTVAEVGLQEAVLWGKGEIEDQLFQPKNDHLLFAYFGVSLQLRRRSVKMETRAILAAKRKAIARLDEHSPVLVRDATDVRYPYLDEDETKSRKERGRWRLMTYLGCFSDGLHFLRSRHFAYVNNEKNEWDFAETMDDGPVHAFDDPWRKGRAAGPSAHRDALLRIWDALPPSQKGWYESYLVLPYENIIDIDEQGDEWSSQPHLYTTEFSLERGPFSNLFDGLSLVDKFASLRISLSIGVESGPHIGVQRGPPLTSVLADSHGSP